MNPIQSIQLFIGTLLKIPVKRTGGGPSPGNPAFPGRSSARIAVLFLCGILLGVSGCDDNKKNQRDLEEQRQLFIMLNAPPNALAACEASVSSALNCADAAGGGGTGGVAYQSGYVDALERIYQLSVPAPRGAAEVCSVLAHSPRYPDPTNQDVLYSTGARVCFFSCEQGFWERNEQNGRCTGSGFFLLSPADDEDYKTCLEDCLARGTIFP